MNSFNSLAFIAFAAPLFFMSCKHEVIPTVDSDSICFERDVLPLIVSNCATSGCHDAATAEDGYVLTNYATITRKGVKAGNPDGSELYEVILENEMPPKNPMSADQKAIIKAWIAGGAENGMNCSSDCDSNVYTYSQAVTPIVTKYCIGCHTYPGASGNLDLSSHSAMKSIGTSGKLMGVLYGNGYPLMPPGNSQIMTDCEIKQLQKWIQDGCPEN